jgi:hypothetical protein
MAAKPFFAAATTASRDGDMCPSDMCLSRGMPVLHGNRHYLRQIAVKRG